MIAYHISYDVVKDLNTTKCNITFEELSEVSLKFRSHVYKGLKLDINNAKIVGCY